MITNLTTILGDFVVLLKLVSFSFSLLQPHSSTPVGCRMLVRSSNPPIHCFHSSSWKSTPKKRTGPSEIHSGSDVIHIGHDQSLNDRRDIVFLIILRDPPKIRFRIQLKKPQTSPSGLQSPAVSDLHLCISPTIEAISSAHTPLFEERSTILSL